MAMFQLDRRVLRVSGPEARGFLHNLLTQDVETLTEGARYAALLTPQGKVITDMMVATAGDALLLDVPSARADDLLRRLTMYKLRAQVNVEATPLVIVWSESRFDGANTDPRTPSGELGWRAIAAASEAPNGDARLAQKLLDFGAPDLTRDATPEEVFALEALLDELHGVDFAKGCFVGQENVSRMKRRATTRRKFCPIVFDGAAIAAGAPVRAGEAELGAVRGGGDGRAMALLRLDRAQEAQAAGTPITAAGREMRLDPPPWLILPASSEG
jgi:folate-binding protein YgfZ